MLTYIILMFNKKNAENAEKYNCEICNFVCSKKSNYSVHLNTRKHISLTNNELSLTTKNAENKIYKCETCNKLYSSRVGLWYHNKKCNKNIIIDTEKQEEKQEEMNKLTAIMMELIKSNSELQKQFTNTNNTTNNNNIITNNNTMNNSNNKTFNLQLFLNEQCKDAMNLSDFMESIQLNLTDLENMDKLGYVECMFKNIFGHMDFISIFDRPLHCSDFKRGIIYIKENGIWEKEDMGHSKLINAIRTVEKKNFKLLKEWTEKHPSFSDSNSPHNDKYVKLFGETMSGDKHNLSKLIRKLSKECVIDKSNL